MELERFAEIESLRGLAVECANHLGHPYLSGMIEQIAGELLVVVDSNGFTFTVYDSQHLVVGAMIDLYQDHYPDPKDVGRRMDKVRQIVDERAKAFSERGLLLDCGFYNIASSEGARAASINILGHLSSEPEVSYFALIVPQT